MDEVNPMAEMGFVHDKQIIIEPQGFLTPADTIRDAACEFIPHGDKLYDIFDRYNLVTTYVLNRDESNNTDSARLITPFLKAFDVTDYALRKYYDDNLPLMKNAGKVMDYFNNLLPTFIDSRMYEHASYTLSEKLNIPISAFNTTSLSLDGTRFSHGTEKSVREDAEAIAYLPVSNAGYVLNVPVELDDAEVNMISTFDDLFQKKYQKNECASLMQGITSVGANEKAYALLDIRKGTQVDLDGTVYIGGERIDYQVLDLVKDGNGLAMSFNGSEFAVHGSNVAVLSDDCTTAAVLVAKFYDTGIQGVFDLIDNWNRKYLENSEFSFDPLVRELLKNHPRKLPEVYRITRENVEEISLKSDAYRRKMVSKAHPKTV